MSNYPGASTAAWYQDDYPGATMDPNVVVLHTTEGTSLPGYSGGATAPNYTAVPDFKAKRLKWFAHFPDEKSSRALRNLAGGVETNTLNVIQVELVGTCDPRAHASWKSAHIFWADPPEWALRDLAEFLADMSKRHGVQLRGPSKWAPYPSSYANGAGQRMSGDQWRNFYGVCGHQHVPENVHGDPGALPWATVQRLAINLLEGKVPAKPKPTKASPNWDAIYRNAVKAERALGDRKAPARRKALAAIKRQAARFSIRY